MRNVNPALLMYPEAEGLELAITQTLSVSGCHTSMLGDRYGAITDEDRTLTLPIDDQKLLIWQTRHFEDSTVSSGLHIPGSVGMESLVHDTGEGFVAVAFRKRKEIQIYNAPDKSGKNSVRLFDQAQIAMCLSVANLVLERALDQQASSGEQPLRKNRIGKVIAKLFKTANRI